MGTRVMEVLVVTSKALADSIGARLANDGRKEEEFTSLSPKEALEWLTKDSQDGKIKYGFQRILRKFGHRCLREFDLDRCLSIIVIPLLRKSGLILLNMVEKSC